MKFTLGTNELVFDAGASYPYSRPLGKVQAMDRSASGKIDVEKLGPSITTRTLFFIDMSKNDFLGYSNWYDIIADGAVNEFEFTDEYGVVGNVIITSPANTIRETTFELYAGTVTLEYV